MIKYQIAIVVGSIRKDSFNRKLANAIVKLAAPEFSFNQVQISDLPLYNQDNDANQAESVKRLKSEIKSAQGILFVTPEYNRSIPGVLKNAIDHAFRAPSWPKRLDGQACRYFGRLDRCYRHSHGATAFAQHPRSSKRTSALPT